MRVLVSCCGFRRATKRGKTEAAAIELICGEEGLASSYAGTKKLVPKTFLARISDGSCLIRS